MIDWIAEFTFIQARLEELLDEFEGLRFVIFDGLLDEFTQLLCYFVTDETESRHRWLVVWDHVTLLESTASELVEILARIHRLVHVLQQLSSYTQYNQQLRNLPSYLFTFYTNQIDLLQFWIPSVPKNHGKSSNKAKKTVYNLKASHIQGFYGYGKLSIVSIHAFNSIIYLTTHIWKEKNDYENDCHYLTSDWFII